MKNPFQIAGISGAPYYDEINSEVKDKIIQLFRDTNNLFSIAITGDPGTGKSSMIGHIRNEVEKHDNAVCVIIKVNQLSPLNAIAYYTLQIIIKDLARISDNGLSYLQEIALNIYNQCKDSLASNQKFNVEKIRSIYQQNNPEFNSDTNILRAIIWTYNKIAEENNIDNYIMPIALNWLKGEDINEDEANILKLPRQSSKIREDESSSLERLMRTLSIVAKYKKIIIAFDEWESDIINPSTGMDRPSAIADFVKTLHDNLVKENHHDFKISVLLISSLLPATWTRLKRAATKTAIVARLCSYPELREDAIKLEPFLSDENRLKLVEFWIKSLTKNQTQNPYHPFTQEKIKNSSNNPTPRELWQWCAANWPPHLTQSTLEEEFRLSRNKINFSLLSDDDKIANLLYFSFSSMKEKTIANVTISEIEPMPKKDKFQLKITCIEDNKVIIIGLGICQKIPITVVAMLRRIIQYNKYGLSRGCLVRSQSLTLRPESEADKLLSQLITQQKGKRVDLIEDDISELNALKQAVDHFNINQIPLTPDDQKFQTKILADNRLIKEILSFS